MKLQKIIDQLQKLHPKKIDLSLDRTFNLLEKLDNPQNKLKNVINVVGTNGKYSTIKILQSILNESGYKCNIYLSPHLQNYTERFIYNDKEINKNDLADLLELIIKVNGSDKITVFEALTCAFLKYSEKFNENINIIEAGLFHKFDATNVFKKNLCSIVTSINLDHLNWLKNKSIEGVIHEKTANLPKSKIIVSKQENKNILTKIKKSLKMNKSEKYFYGESFKYSNSKKNFIKYSDIKGNLILSKPNILGEHQITNLSTAITTARNLFNIQNTKIKKGLTKIDLKGRLQEIKSGKLKQIARNNYLIIDGGHNLNAAKSIAKWMDTLNKDIHLIVGMMKDKEHKKFINVFKNKIKSLTLIDIPNQEGAIKKEEFKLKILNDYPDVKIADNIKEAIKLNAIKSNNSYLGIVGSLYLVGEVLNLN